MNIHFYNGDIKERLYCTKDVGYVTEKLLKVPQEYKEGAVVPNGRWDKIENIGVSELKCDISESIFIVKPDIQELEYLVAIGQELIKSEHDLSLFYKTLDCEFVFKGIEKYLRNNFSKKKEIVRLGIAIRENNLVTSTMDDHINKYVGLHVDSWDKNQVENKYKARNRICFNISNEPRFLYFNHQSIKKILSLNKYNKLPSLVKLLKDYLLTDQVLIYKIKIEPGEAYIAPTENIIHDATTLNRKHKDLTLTYLGFFEPNLIYNKFYKL